LGSPQGGLLPLTSIITFWLLFGGSHIFLSHPPIRQPLIARFGLVAFKAVYSAISFATFIPLIIVFSRARHLSPLPALPQGPLLATGLTTLAIIILLQAFATASPITTAADLLGVRPAGPRGIQTITRHPVNLAFVLFGVGHAAANPFGTDLAFFLGFVLFSILSSLHQDYRVRLSGEGAAVKFMEKTSLVPFAAILTGKQHLALRQWNLPALLGAILLTVLLHLFHSRLFGGLPLH